MTRTLLAFALLILVCDGAAWAQFPYESHTPMTNFGRYHGIGFGPGYHNPTVRRTAVRTPARHVAPWKKTAPSSLFPGSNLYPVATSPARETHRR